MKTIALSEKIRELAEQLEALSKSSDDERQLWLKMLTKLQEIQSAPSDSEENTFTAKTASPAFMPSGDRSGNSQIDSDTPNSEMDLGPRFSRAEEILLLSGLRDRGVLTPDEYLQITDRILRPIDAVASSTKPAIFDAVLADDLDLLNEILDKTPHAVNACTHQHLWTPLHIAVAEENTTLVKRLLERGADPNARSKQGKTPLIHAGGRGNGAIVLLLLEHGADPNVVYKDRTAAMRAYDRGYDGVAGVIESYAHRSPSNGTYKV